MAAHWLATGEARGPIWSPTGGLIHRGFLNAFDVTPDGKYPLFDRTRHNSDVVLIGLPKR